MIQYQVCEQIVKMHLMSELRFVFYVNNKCTIPTSRTHYIDEKYICFHICFMALQVSMFTMSEYQLSLPTLIPSVLAIIIVGVLYPIKFFQDNEGDDITLGWSYGLAWGLAVLLLGAALMLILDKGRLVFFLMAKQ